MALRHAFPGIAGILAALLRAQNSCREAGCLRSQELKAMVYSITKFGLNVTAFATLKKLGDVAITAS